jgi:hypothetical protein
MNAQEAKKLTEESAKFKRDNAMSFAKKDFGSFIQQVYNDINKAAGNANTYIFIKIPNKDYGKELLELVEDRLKQNGYRTSYSSIHEDLFVQWN